jgi:branched-chain amino acid transport system substrate-binding protein
LIDGAQENAKEIGLEVVYNRSYPPTTNDFSPIVRAIQATHPDVVFVASYPSDSVGMVNALHEIGLKARLVGGGMVGLQTASIKTQLGPKLNGLVVYNFLAGCEFQAPQKCLRLIKVYAINFIP